MKISAYFIKDIEDAEPKYREVLVSFEDDPNFPNEAAEVYVRLDIQDLPISEIKELAITKAKKFVKAASLAS